jgi:hypothetical protein
LGKRQGEVQVLFHLLKNAWMSPKMIFTWHKGDDAWKILQFQGVKLRFSQPKISLVWEKLMRGFSKAE